MEIYFVFSRNIDDATDQERPDSKIKEANSTAKASVIPSGNR